MTKIAIHTELNTSFALTGGERVWKLTGAIERMSINGRDYFDQSTLNDKTLYTSPYMVVTDREYTKHYYIESQRVTSKLGGGMANNLVDPNSGTLDFIDGDVNQLSTDLMENLRQTTCVERLQIDIEPQMWFIAESIQQDNVEEELYFYLSDHLGSSSWITDASGNVDQHLAYMPFGESFIDQRASGHDIRFKFTGKERDSKTGFDYFGARYYVSDLSIWLSVDPLSDMYPSTSPYMYVRGNPIMLIDPNGMNDDDFYFNKDGKLDKYVENDQPDRVFVGTGEVTDEEVLGFTVSRPEYEQVEMSSAEVEQKMGDNGYKKVTKTVRVENDQVETPYSTGNYSVTYTTGTEVTTGTDEKYVPKNYVETGRTNTKHEVYDQSHDIVTNAVSTHEVYTEKVLWGTENRSWFHKILSLGRDGRSKEKDNFYE